MKRKIIHFNKAVLFFFLILMAISLLSCTSSPVTSPEPVTTTVTATTTVPTTQTTTITATTTSTKEETTTVTSTLLPAGSDNFVNAVKKILPSIVTIEDQQTTTGGFGLPLTVTAAGTGWIIDPNGIIVTNAHVVYNATNIKVTLSDNRVFTASAVQTDLNNDLAVLKIAASGLDPASIGDSSNLVMGQAVAAVGNSLDMGVRVTGGLVSRLNVTTSYSIQNQTVKLKGLIETDAAINPGNSGGVLIDTSGDVVGITNASLAGPSTDTIGFGYAIGITEAMPVIKNLMSSLH